MSFEGEKDFLNCLEFLDMIRDFNINSNRSRPLL